MAGEHDRSALLAWLQRVWPDRAWQRAEMVHGAFHEVAIVRGEVAGRVATPGPTASRVEREARLHATVAALSLPVAVPSVVAGPVSFDNASGFLTTFVPGEPMTAADWADVREPLATLLEALRTTSLPPGAAQLMTPRAWCGGTRWRDVVHDHLLPRLPQTAQRRAIQVVDDVLQTERDARPTLLHGDFGLHNILWHAGTPVSLVDLDHAAIGDPAIDVAPLVGTFGSTAVQEIVDRSLLTRALRHRASLPLQVAAAAPLCDRPALRDHALQNFAGRLNSRTLYDPDGRVNYKQEWA